MRFSNASKHLTMGSSRPVNRGACHKACDSSREGLGGALLYIRRFSKKHALIGKTRLNVTSTSVAGSGPWSGWRQHSEPTEATQNTGGGTALLYRIGATRTRETRSRP